MTYRKHPPQAWRIAPRRPEGWRQLGVSVASLTLALALGMALPWVLRALWDERGEDLPTQLEALQREAAQLRSATSATSAKTVNPLPALAHRPNGPALAEAQTLWVHVQQSLHAHGLQVQALQPQALSTSQDLPEHSLSLRLQGQWRDWLAWQQAMQEHAPWWAVTHWQVLAQPDEGPTQPNVQPSAQTSAQPSPQPSPLSAQPAGAVHIELQARIGWWPPALHSRSEDSAAANIVNSTNTPVWQVGPLALKPAASTSHPSPVAQGLANTFAKAPNADPALATPAAPAAPAWRLLGIWREGQTPHALVQAGPRPELLQAQQTLAHAPYRVRHIGPAHIELEATRPGLPGQRLTLPGSPP